jgi:ABC-type transport system substrate-binding protein
MNPKTKDLIVMGDLLQTGYLTMLVTKPPFDNPLVREAVNLAIDKERIVRLINNRGVPANQLLPPLMPGYDSDFVGLKHDPARAQELLAEAGHPNGFTTELYAMNVGPNPRIAQAIQQDLARIGISAELNVMSQSVVIEAGGQGAAPLLWSGGMAWISDYPDPSGFYWPILSCKGAVPGGWNWAKHCDEALDSRGEQADAMVTPELAEKRIELWRSIFSETAAQMPWAPIFHEQGVLIHSERIGGDPVYFVSPVHTPIWYEYLYAEDAQ